MLDEQYHFELALRFIVFRGLPDNRLNEIRNLHEFLTDEMVRLASDTAFSAEAERDVFGKTFHALSVTLGSDAFRKYDHAAGKFQGPFLITAFEVIGMGIWIPRRIG